MEEKLQDREEQKGWEGKRDVAIIQTAPSSRKAKYMLLYESHSPPLSSKVKKGRTQKYFIFK